MVILWFSVGHNFCNVYVYNFNHIPPFIFLGCTRQIKSDHIRNHKITFIILMFNRIIYYLYVYCFDLLHVVHKYSSLSSVYRLSRNLFHRQSVVSAIDSKEPRGGDADRDTPVKYTTSKAHQHNPFETFLTPQSTAPSYQPYVILFSTAVFFLYFFVLREENDIDDDLSKSLYEKIPGLEEKSMLARIRNAQELGQDTVELERQLLQFKQAATASRKSS